MSYCRMGPDSDIYAWNDISGKVGIWDGVENRPMYHDNAAIYLTLLRAKGVKIPEGVEDEILEDSDVNTDRIDEVRKRCTALTSYLADCKKRKVEPEPETYKRLLDDLYKLAPENMRPMKGKNA